jgi:hypothetical protein
MKCGWGGDEFLEAFVVVFFRVWEEKAISRE